MASRMQKYEFKIVLLGEGCVGKTSLVLRYVENKFNEQHQSTIQASFLKKIINVNGNRTVLNIWDTAGQEQFHALGPIYYRGSHGALLVYDVTDPDSFLKVKKWVKELRKMLGNEVSIAIIGNKSDLLPINEQKSPQINSLISEAINYASSINTSGTINSASHHVTSAKHNQGIDETFLFLTKQMMDRFNITNSSNNSNARNADANNSSVRTLRLEEDNDSNIDGRDANNQGKCNC